MIRSHVISSRSIRLCILILAVLLVLRLIAQTFVPLMPQEAYYWMYWRHPSLSYFDHPPMVAWLIGLGVKLFGTNEFGVRVICGVLTMANAWLMYYFTRLWWSRQVAIISTLLTQVGPVFYALGFLATMDPALVTFWLVCMIGFSHAVKGKTWGWYLAGVGLGLALLTKYTGVFLLPGVGILLLLRREWRHYLKSIHPYAGALIGLLMFWPVIQWNAQHDWASFRFQFLNRFDEDRTGHDHSTLEFIVEQVATATPVVLFGTGLIVAHGLRRRRLTARDAMALAFGLPLIASIAYKSWTYPIHINWTAPAYIGLVPATIELAFVLARRRHISALWSLRGGALGPTLAVCSIINVGLLSYLLLLQPKMHWIHAFGPWRQLSEQVEHCEDKLEAESGKEPLIIADGKYELASELAFYRTQYDASRMDPDHPWLFTTSQYGLGDYGLGYKFWIDRSHWIGRDCIFVDMGTTIENELKSKFKSVSIVWTGKANNGRTYRIAECHDLLN